MTRKQIYSFDDTSDTGLDLVPENNFVYIEDSDGSGTPKLVVLTDITSITDSTTVSTFLGLTSQWSYPDVGAEGIGTITADIDMNNYNIIEVKTLQFNGLYDNGTKSTNFTLTLANGQYQEVTLSGNATMTISTTGVTGCATMYLHITQSGASNTLTLPSGLWEGGNTGANSEVDGQLDILMIHYTGSAYVYNYMNDVS